MSNRCELCKCWYEPTTNMISTFTMSHPSGESLDVKLISCPHCEQLSLPEQYNMIAYSNVALNKAANHHVALR